MDERIVYTFYYYIDWWLWNGKTTVSTHKLIILALVGSCAMLMSAFVFQLLGYTPCKICIWQRWPHVIAILAGALWLIKPDFRFIILGIFSTFLTSGLGLYHSGIEQKWWSGPTTCTSEKIGNLSSNELFAKIMSAPITRCDEIAWTFANLSMASWNAILSLSLTIVWVIAIKNK